MDDFLLFKQMMVTRQRQLHLATLKAMEKAERKRKAQERRDAANAMVIVGQEEQNQLDLALKLSNKITERDHRRRQKEEEEEQEQLEKAIQASLEDQELREAELRRKEAELQEAILLEVKYEKERLEQTVSVPPPTTSILQEKPNEIDSSATSKLAELAKIEKKVRSLPPIKRAALPPLKIASVNLPSIENPSSETSASVLANDPIARAEYVRQQRELLIQKRVEQRDNAKKMFEEEVMKKAGEEQDVTSSTANLSNIFANKLRLDMSSKENSLPGVSAEMLERIRIQMNQLESVREELGK